MLCLLVTLITFGDIAIHELHGTAAFYAALAREMFEARDLLAPFEGPQAYLLKPPLAFWLSAAAGHLFGINDFAMTLPSRLAGLGCAALSFLLTRRLYGAAAGWFAVLMFVANGIYIQFTTNFRMDSLMTFGALLMLWGYLNLDKARGAHYVCLGFALATLTKGPMIFAIALVFVPHMVVTGSWRHAARRQLWALAWLLLPLWWYAYLWLMHGSEVSSQLNADFWRDNSALGLSATQSALLEYVFKPFNRLWPWLPLFVLGLGFGLYDWWRARKTGRAHADLVLCLSLFALNYGIAVVKPDPDVRYLYPSLPLLAIFAGGMMAHWCRARIPHWALATTAVVTLIATGYTAAISVQGAADRAGLRTMQALAQTGAFSAQTALVLTDALPPPGPRRNDPLRDSVYFYTGIAPPNLVWDAATHDYPADAQYFFARRKRAYEAQLKENGFTLVARSAKLLLFKRP